jgi:transcription elongation GreA/GreB family factor
MHMTLKEKIYLQYVQLINQKIAQLEQVLADLKESGANETKSTAGDKHETALAMLQIEQANKRAQLQELQEQKAALNKINPTLIPAVIVAGSLIKTNKGYFFMSTALGKIIFEEQTVIALSPQSPLGKKLMGNTAGDTATINNMEYLIEQIC